jgi:hypothetical protein
MKWSPRRVVDAEGHVEQANYRKQIVHRNGSGAVHYCCKIPKPDNGLTQLGDASKLASCARCFNETNLIASVANVATPRPQLLSRA